MAGLLAPVAEWCDILERGQISSSISHSNTQLTPLIDLQSCVVVLDISGWSG